jgi:DNA-binding MarR family transcriptional regulator
MREEEQISAAREFNRFYTARLGLLRKRHLDGDHSLTEARILYEIGAAPGLTASSLRITLGLNAGYVSRILTLLTKLKLVRQTTSKQDAREKLLTLSNVGKTAFARLNEQSNRQVRGLLANVNSADCAALLDSLSKIRSILSEPKPIRVVRLSESNEDAIRLLQEYYEAVSVVQRDTPRSDPEDHQ